MLLLGVILVNCNKKVTKKICPTSKLKGPQIIEQDELEYCTLRYSILSWQVRDESTDWIRTWVRSFRKLTTQQRSLPIFQGVVYAGFCVFCSIEGLGYVKEYSHVFVGHDEFYQNWLIAMSSLWLLFHVSKMTHVTISPDVQKINLWRVTKALNRCNWVTFFWLIENCIYFSYSKCDGVVTRSEIGKFGEEDKKYSIWKCNQCETHLWLICDPLVIHPRATYDSSITHTIIYLWLIWNPYVTNV